MVGVRQTQIRRGRHRLGNGMNIYVSEDVKHRFRCLDFRGKPFKEKNGKTYVRAYHRTLYVTMYYCFEDDFAWLTDGDKPWNY